MNNPMFQLKNDTEYKYMSLHVWVKDRYRLIWPDVFFSMFWRSEYMYRPMCVGPCLYANFSYIGNDIFVYFYGYGTATIQMALPDFQNLLRKVYDDIMKYDLNKLYLGRKGYQSENLFCYPDSLNALFSYMNFKIRRNRKDDKKTVPFQFSFVEPYDCDTGYIVNVGNSQYSSCISDYTTDYNEIRLSLEHMVTMYERTEQLRFFYEDSPSTIRLESVDSFTEGQSTEKKVIVTILPDEFYKGPLLCGICKKRAVLSSLYLGLLSLFITPSNSYYDETDLYSWDEFRLTSYNKLQSCVIENYVQGIVETEYESYPRQRWINSVDELEEDYASLSEKLKVTEGDRE